MLKTLYVAILSLSYSSGALAKVSCQDEVFQFCFKSYAKQDQQKRCEVILNKISWKNCSQVSSALIGKHTRLLKKLDKQATESSFEFQWSEPIKWYQVFRQAGLSYQEIGQLVYIHKKYGLIIYSMLAFQLLVFITLPFLFAIITRKYSIPPLRWFIPGYNYLLMMRYCAISPAHAFNIFIPVLGSLSCFWLSLALVRKIQYPAKVINNQKK